MDYQQRRQLQAQDTRRAILAAAAQLSRQGRFDKMTVRDVCAAAGVTTGAFYHHFSSKEDLLKQGFTSVDVFLEKALEPYRDLPPLDRLEAFRKGMEAVLGEGSCHVVTIRPAGGVQIG